MQNLQGKIENRIEDGTVVSTNLPGISDSLVAKVNEACGEVFRYALVDPITPFRSNSTGGDCGQFCLK